jgi:hypothetical protein
MGLGVLSIALVSVGCDSESDYFPIEVGSVVTYRLRGFSRQTTLLRMQRVISVDGARGIEIQGPNGVSRVAWAKGELKAQELANARFEPDITLLAPARLSDTLVWNGKVGCLGSAQQATAYLVQKAATEDYQGRHLQVINATLTLTFQDARVVELDSTYAKGLGLIHQKQRTGENFDLEMMRL